MTTQDQTPEIDKTRLLAQAVANAVAGGARVESQSPEQAILVRRNVSPARFTLCLLVWWPGFFFGHHRSESRQIVRIDDLGNALIQDV
ncbi:MAG: hypothetical protein OXS30_07335 [Chloroflexota bacterium]|nr:hypothetical protein [Chloroflexota bacterium]